MKKIFIMSFFLAVFASLIFADYNSDIANANKQYKAGNYRAALAYYQRAYKAHPGKQVQSYIIYLQNKLRNPSGTATRSRKAASSDGVNWAEKNMLISANPVGLIGMTVPLHFEMCLNKGSGLGFNASPSFFGFAGWTTFGFQGGAEYNLYFQNHAPNGWFAGPGAGIYYISANYSDSAGDKASASSTGFYINGHGGYRWIWDGGFLVDVTATLQYISLTLSMDVNGTKETLPFGGFGGGIGADIGFAW